MDSASPPSARDEAQASPGPTASAPAGVLGHTPHKGGPSSREPFEEYAPKPGEDKTERRRIALNDEMKWVQSDLGDWVEEFLPCSDPQKEAEDMEKLNFKPFKIDMSRETAMYPDLADMFNDYLTVIGCTDFVVRYTDSHKDTHTPGSTETRDHNPLKPDLAFLPTSDEAKKAYEIGQRPREKRRGKKVASQQATDTASASSTGHSSATQLPQGTATSLPQPSFTSLGSAGAPRVAPSTAFGQASSIHTYAPQFSSSGALPTVAHLPAYHPTAARGQPLMSITTAPVYPSPNAHDTRAMASEHGRDNSRSSTSRSTQQQPASEPRSAVYSSTSAPQPLGPHSNTQRLSAAPMPQPVPGTVAAPPGHSPAADPPDGDGPLAPSNARMTWAWAEVVVEVKHRTHQYPFSVTEFLGTSQRRKIARGQLADYASEIFRRQHREFLFLISICDEYARILRFDRGGAVVSRTIDYIKHPKAMGMILYRLFGPGSSRELRGHDPTATLVDSADAELFRGLSTHPDYQADTNLVAALAHAATVNWPIYKIEIPYQWPGADEQIPVRRNSVYPITTREFLVGRPAFSSSSMTGRGTKCMVAYDETAKKPVFIKDMWRPDSSRLQTELQTYQQLWDGEDSVGEAFIPTCLGGGDVSHDGHIQRTRTDKYFGKQGHLARIHSRIVLKEICRRLVDFKTTVELVSGVFDAVQAHERAWIRGILHRDVSVGNILLFDFYDGVRWSTIGLLADWDLAKTKEQLDDFSPTQTFRSGTWQFMSAQLQHYKDKRHEVSDDLESFLHVLDWCSFKYLPHSLSSSPRNLALRMRAVYDESVPLPDADGDTVAYKGTEEKYAVAFSRGNVVRGLPLEHPFTIMLGGLHELCWRHYTITRPVPPAEEANEDTSLFKRQYSKLARFRPELATRQSGAAPAQTVNPSTSGETTSAGSSSSASLGAPAVSDPKETSPLKNHSQFMQIMADAVVTGLDVGRWPVIKKDMTQAQGLPSTTGTPLASRTGSKRTMESGDADASRPQKRQKPTRSRADEDEDDDENDHIDDT